MDEESIAEQEDNPTLLLAVRKAKAGQKLSNRERKEYAKFKEKLLGSAKQRAARNASKKDELANFVCDQVPVDEAFLENSRDVRIERFSVSVGSKRLFDDAELHLTHGNKYGVIGPNGQGKSTLLKLMASDRLSVPRAIDKLYVEQEVKADMTPAIEAVLSADSRRLELLTLGPMLQAALASEGDGAAAFVASTKAIELLIDKFGRDSPVVNAAKSQLPILEADLLRGGSGKSSKGKPKALSADATQAWVLEKQ